MVNKATSETIDGEERSRKIAALNDQLRKHGVGGQIVMAAGVNGLGGEMVSKIFKAIQDFSAFDHDNDPYGEHDFAVVTGQGLEKIYFKIDYYDQDLIQGSEDPANPEVTTRVLTILLPREY